MRPLRSLVLFTLAVFLGGALLGPWLYWLAQHLAHTWPSLHGLAGKPLYRYVLRAATVIALCGLWPLLRSLGARSWRETGLEHWRGQWPRLAAGLTLGFGSLAVAAGLPLAFGARELDGGLTGAWWARLPGIAATALAVAVLEELLFRGALYGVLRRSMSWKAALALSSAVYAASHFLRNAESPAEVHWWSGLALLPHMVSGLARLDQLIPGCIGLFVAGMILALAFERTRNLYFSIGLHAGWVFWLRSYNFMTDRRPETAEWLWGTGKLYDGWISFAALALAGCIVWRLNQNPPQPQPPPFDTNGRQPA